MPILIPSANCPRDIGGPATHGKKIISLLQARVLAVNVVTYGEARGDGIVSVSRKIPRGLRHLIYLVECLRAAYGVDVDQQAGRRQTHIKRRDQALATGQQSRIHRYG